MEKRKQAWNRKEGKQAWKRKEEKQAWKRKDVKAWKRKETKEVQNQKRKKKIENKKKQIKCELFSSYCNFSFSSNFLILNEGIWSSFITKKQKKERKNKGIKIIIEEL